MFVSYVNHREDAREVVVDTALAAAYANAFEALAAKLGKENNLSVVDYSRLPDVLRVEEREEDQNVVRALFERALGGAIDSLSRMREDEGTSMRLDILEKLDNIEGIRNQIAERAPLVVTEYRDKLHQRIAQLAQGEIDEMRLITEVAIFADRAAIDEELVRLVSHIAQIRAAAQLKEPVGRKLDFLVQELNREINTIGSKAGDSAIAQLVVQAKGEIEKLREQVQNIE